MKARMLFSIFLLAVSLQAKESWLFIRPLNFYYDPAKLFVW